MYKICLTGQNCYPLKGTKVVLSGGFLITIQQLTNSVACSLGGVARVQQGKAGEAGKVYGAMLVLSPGDAESIRGCSNK